MPGSVNHSRAERARRRRDWAGAVTTLADQDDAMLVRQGSAEQRIHMLWRVTLDAWASSGRPLPAYERSNMPGRIVRG